MVEQHSLHEPAFTDQHVMLDENLPPRCRVVSFLPHLGFRVHPSGLTSVGGRRRVVGGEFNACGGGGVDFGARPQKRWRVEPCQPDAGGLIGSPALNLASGFSW